MEWTDGFSWELRIGALVAFLGLVSGVEVAVRGRRATRWKDSLILLACSGGAALLCAILLGFAVELVPGEWRPRPKGPEQTITERTREIGLELGAVLGLAISGVLLVRRRRNPSGSPEDVASLGTGRTSPRARVVGIGLRLAALLVLPAFCTPGALQALMDDPRDELDRALSDRALAHYEAMRAHLREPDAVYGTLDVFVPQFAVVALSHTACGLLNVGRADPELHAETLPLFDEIVARATRAPVSPYRSPVEEVRVWGDQNLYLSHLALILGTRRLAGGDARFDSLHRRLVEHLRERSLADPHAHARSFPGSPRFPADQAVLLCALQVHDELHGTTFASEAIRRWRRSLHERFLDPATGLPQSCLDSSFPSAALPRGCATGWLCLYLAHFDPALGRDWYRRMREHLYEPVLGAGGFREYPEDSGGSMNVDSGPIVLGVGMAASAFGLGAARLHGDRDAYRTILRSAGLVGMPSPFEPARYRLSPLLGDAILLHALTARPWFDDPEPTDAETPSAFPTLAVLVLIAHAAWVLAWAMSIRRRW